MKKTQGKGEAQSEGGKGVLLCFVLFGVLRKKKVKGLIGLGFGFRSPKTEKPTSYADRFTIEILT